MRGEEYINKLEGKIALITGERRPFHGTEIATAASGWSIDHPERFNCRQYSDCARVECL
jgi:hypothetical protein